MKTIKNNQGILVVLLTVVISVFIITGVVYAVSVLVGYNFYKGNIDTSGTQINVDETNGDFSEANILLMNSKQIIESLLTADEKGLDPDITIINATDKHIKANLFYNPGGAYVLAAKVDKEWKRVLGGNGIPQCSDIRDYNFPREMVPTCVNEMGQIWNNDWELIKRAVKNCEVKEVGQTHLRYVNALLRDGSRLEGIEPILDDVIDLASASQKDCGEIMMATE